ncbi:MAG: Crp/Fnr family transcriptional regulator [Phenylobacterium sp.]
MLEVTSMLDAAKHWTVRYGRGQSIYAEGDSASGIYRVDKGCVRLQVNSTEGERQIVAFLFPGDVFGMSVDRRTSAAEAVCDIDLTRYSLPSVLELATRSTSVLLQMIRAADIVYSDLAHHVEQITHLPANERVLWFLDRLSRRQGVRPGEPVRLPMSRRDISDYLGLKPETLSRIMRQLQDEGHVTTTGRNSFALTRPSFRLSTGPRPASRPAA